MTRWSIHPWLLRRREWRLDDSAFGVLARGMLRDRSELRGVIFLSKRNHSFQSVRDDA